MNKATKRMSTRLEVQVCSLLDSLKIEKKKSRVAIKHLLTVTTMQHNELVAKFQDKIQDIHKEHDRAMCRLQGDRSKEILDNQKFIERLQKQHSKVMTELESEYRLDLTRESA
jgi:hypothetical protein